MAENSYPFSEAVRVSNLLFISRQVGVDADNELVGVVLLVRQGKL